MGGTGVRPNGYPSSNYELKDVLAKLIKELRKKGLIS